MSAHPQWDAWIREGLLSIRTRKLERVLRPLIPTESAVQAYIHETELHAWLDLQPSPDSCVGLQLYANQSQAGSALHPDCQQQAQQGFRKLVLFSLNDYLGLSTHPDVRAAAAAAAQQVGNGPRSSALVGGFTHTHRQLELALARLKGTQDALLFPTGYAANTAVVSVLAAAAASGVAPTGSGNTPQHLDTQQQQGQQPPQPPWQQQQQPQVVIYSDELNHASIIDGARLAARGPGVALQVYRHNDMSHLEQLLAAAPAGARQLVVTDSLFSMDGDYADLPGLVSLRARYGFLLVVDEAHATLVTGQHGGGAAEAAGVCAEVDVHTGTLSKAVGALGGFAACSSELRALLLNRGRSVVFSTALPVPVVAAAAAAVEVANREGWRRQHLQHLMSLVRTRLGVPVTSPIIALVVGSEAAALQLSKELLAAGFHVPAIRPPTVPPGTCRLRLSLSAAHSVQQVHAVLDALQAALRKMPGVQLQSLPHLELQQQQQQNLRCHQPKQDMPVGLTQDQQQQQQQSHDVQMHAVNDVWATSSGGGGGTNAILAKL